MSTGPKASFIIVNWNTCQYLAACLSSIQEVSPAVAAEVIVVDNASRDGSARMVRGRFPSYRLVDNQTNRGFSGGINDGLRYAHGEYILILNPDVVLRKGVVEELIAYLERHADVGAAMPLLRNEDGTVQKGYVRRLPTLMQVLLFSTILAPWAVRRPTLVSRYLERPLRTGDAVEVDQIPGAFLLTTRKIFDTVGPFDEGYRLFFEDVDWCARVREKGLKLVMLPQFDVKHIGGRSFEADEGSRMSARYFVSYVRYFSKRKGKAKASLVAIVLSLSSLLVILKNSVLRGGGDAAARERTALARRTHRNILRLFFRVFVLRQDNEPLA
jgi:N-acetylglucosaminyl-diphospho-decaprenol L-rhamnosyltransferase